MGTGAARRAGHEERVTPKGQRARAELLEAARRVFERDGYLDTRVADIAAEAGVAHGSFYTYFSSKQDVFRSLAQEVSRQLDAAVAPDPADRGLPTVVALDRSNRRYLELYRANSAFWALLEQLSTMDPDVHRIRLAGRQRHVERVARTIRRWQESGVADPEIDAHTTAGALVSMLSNFAYWWFAGGDGYDDETAARTLTGIWARAVGLKEPE
ncbi:TetR/AcrR family transcriptional regulator [Nonomuraea sp. NPDC050536]|uniref:TetR/AcrR family transcriptional regulator n=1 Tax=Nonomuraea sp. NPDC050536 TaxID=3364366 RepID=UPI0037C779D9